MAHLDWKLLMAFEAVARHRSFSRAASELNVQQPAASRRVAALEAQLGVSLLYRTRPYATLTAEGETLFNGLSGSLAQVRSVVDAVQRRSEKNVVTVNTTIGFASCYLMKRLPDFRSRHPDISIELVSRDQNGPYGMEAADVVIAFDKPATLPGVRQVRIFSEELVPAAEPRVAAGVPDDPSALAAQPLLYLTGGLHGGDWRTYFAGTGALLMPPQSEQRFTSFMVYLQAALNGDGIILGWETLLQDHFNLGLLDRVTSRSIKTERGYFACETTRADGNSNATAVMEWLAALG